MMRPWSRGRLVVRTCFWLAIGMTLCIQWKLLSWQHHINNNNRNINIVADGMILHSKAREDLKLRHRHQGEASNATTMTTTTTRKRKTLETMAVPPATRFFLGIFTVSGDYQLRDAVRQNFQIYHDHRICSYGTTAIIMDESSSSSSSSVPSPQQPAPHCQLIYTFVMGAAAAASDGEKVTQILDSSNIPIVTSIPPKELNASLETTIDDITFLNIQENMNQGKTLTWFRYAAQVMTQYDWDYAIKCDSDTGVRVDVFWQWSQQHLPRGGSHIYAGLLKWSALTKSPYMAGQLYILSRDLAQAISNTPLAHPSRDNNIMFVEDADVGYLLSKLSLPLLHLVSLPNDPKKFQLPWKHSLKTADRHRHFRGRESKRLLRDCAASKRDANDRTINCSFQ